MNEQNLHTYDEKEFEALLTQTAMELPPEQMVGGVNPWRNAINRVLWGFGLITVTLNFLGLQYILPLLGYLLLLQGFRMLRRENTWFRVCWLVTIPRLALFSFHLVTQATLWPELQSFAVPEAVLTWVSVLMALFHYIAFWNALNEIRLRAGVEPKNGAMLGLIFWYGVMCLLGLIQYNGFLVPVGMILLYILILRQLYKLSKELDTVGYCIRPAGIRISTTLINGVILALLLAGLLCGKLLGSRFPMDWQKQEQGTEPTVIALREQLTEKGFPAEVLEDLTQEDLLECLGAQNVVVQQEELPVNEGRQVSEMIGDTLHYTTVYDQKELLFTHIAVQLEDDRWKMFHHFRWQEKGRFPGTEALYLDIDRRWWMEDKSTTENGVIHGGERLTGQLLYDNGGETYTAPYFALERPEHVENKGMSLIGMSIGTNQVLGDFSFPAGGGNQRGYVSYEGRMNDSNQIYFSAWVTYVHQKNRWNFPVTTAGTRVEQGTTHNDAHFKGVQGGLQFEIIKYNK